MSIAKENESLRGFWWRHHSQAIQATHKTFGFGEPLLRVLGQHLWREATMFGMGLDNLFFPKWQEMKVDRPVFIIGHPRSGTTMLQRSLTTGDDFVVFRFWELLFPSLSSRKLVGPIINRMIRDGKDVIVPKAVGHLFALGEVDEEEFLFLFHAMTQFYPPLSGLAFSEQDFDDIVFCDNIPENLRRESMEWLDGCFRRQLLSTGRQRLVTKMNYSALRVRSLLEFYPDARIIYLVRSPFETIPSHLSLHQNMCYHQWGKDSLPADVLERYIRRRYEHNVSLYRYFEDQMATNVLPASQVITVRYDDMMSNLEGEVGRVAEFCELELSDSLTSSIAEQGKIQRGYKREHSNHKLEDFGLTSADLLRDLGFIFDRYGFDREAH